MNKESTIFGVSLRGCIAIAVTITVCIMGFLGREIKEPLYSIALAVILFYFNKNNGQRTPTGSDNASEGSPKG